ncbi:ArsR/SmtB family transcription factor, partial [Agrobacterium tumefaciens]|uniref:ArsR/SmtB family transcription factor n=1 Tax=Agrobacterium tumefaciens TaxID=358 RepID=UPI001F246310
MFELCNDVTLVGRDAAVVGTLDVLPDRRMAGAAVFHQEFDEIGERMGVSATNVSFHLKELERSGLISQRRESRSIIYSASYEALADLVKFLMEDCCAGHPAIRENVERTDDCGTP